MQCPIPISSYPRVLLAHGGGGRLMHDLIQKMFLPLFESSPNGKMHDGAVFSGCSIRMAMTTDSFVVHPLFFPGGDIGKLAVYGTVNDLAMCGAQPQALSAAFILEEGLEMEVLWKVVQSMANAAREVGVQIVTGDTKVVERGKADGLFINTTGIGNARADLEIHPQKIKTGDRIVLSGDVGRHGMAIMAVREGLEFESAIESDCANLNEMVKDLMRSGIEIHCMRDATRGGLATVLNELSDASGLSVACRQKEIPVRPDVQAACEILGFDPLYVANEGAMVVVVPEKDAKHCVDILRQHPQGRSAAIVGAFGNDTPGVILKSTLGTDRVLQMLSGEQLPRIC